MMDDGSRVELTPAKPTKTKLNGRIIVGVLFFAVVAVIIGVVIGVPLSKRDTTQKTDMEKVQQILKEHPLIDGHNDLAWQIRVYARNKVYKDVKLTEDTRVLWPNTHEMSTHVYPRIPPQTDIPRLNQGRVGGQFWAAFAHCNSIDRDAVRQGLYQADVIFNFIEKYPNDFEFVTTADGIVSAFSKGRIASLIGLEGGHMIGDTLANLRMFYRLGVRYMTLTHTCDLPWATSSTADKVGNLTNQGLSDFGKIVIKEMNRLGMIIDLSHVSHQTMVDTLETTQAPVIFSHSSAYSLCAHTRNVMDDVLMKTAQNKGVVMVNFYNKYISCNENATLSQTADHFDYIKNKIGIDYVGVGADYDGVNLMPTGLEDVSKYPDLLVELLKRGWTEVELKKLIGGNLLRVFRQVEKIKNDMKNIDPYEDILPNDERLFPNCTTMF